MFYYQNQPQLCFWGLPRFLTATLGARALLFEVLHAPELLPVVAALGEDAHQSEALHLVVLCLGFGYEALGFKGSETYSLLTGT